MFLKTLGPRFRAILKKRIALAGMTVFFRRRCVKGRLKPKSIKAAADLLHPREGMRRQPEISGT
jgi:hypothetical protein